MTATGGDSPPLHHQGSGKPAKPPGRAVPLAAAALTFGVFAAIAAAVSSGLTQGADAWGLIAFRNPADLANPLGPAWLQASGRDFSGLGSNGVMAALVLAGSGLLAFARRRRAALFLANSFLGALALNTAIKHWVGRPRPELVPHAARVFTASFPSGHATVTSATCLAAALLLLRARSEPAYRSFAIVVTVALVAIIGASRLYLGVHWPTDVLAGWALGVSWTAVCWSIAMSRQPFENVGGAREGPGIMGQARR